MPLPRRLKALECALSVCICTKKGGSFPLGFEREGRVAASYEGGSTESACTHTLWWRQFGLVCTSCVCWFETHSTGHAVRISLSHRARARAQKKRGLRRSRLYTHRHHHQVCGGCAAPPSKKEQALGHVRVQHPTAQTEKKNSAVVVVRVRARACATARRRCARIHS